MSISNITSTPAGPPLQKPDRAAQQALLKDLIASAQKGDVNAAKADLEKLGSFVSDHDKKAGKKPPFFDFINSIAEAVKTGDSAKLKTAYTAGIKEFRDDAGVTAKQAERKAAFLAERAAEKASGKKDADDGKPAPAASGLPSAVNISA